MTDIFEHYGLSHLSASQINLYTSEPALWVLRYLFGHKDPLSPAAARGISTEKGIEHGLCNPDAPLQECIDLALQDYDRSLTLIVDDKKEKERDGIPGIVEVGLEELRKYGIPTLPEDDHRQQRIEVEIPGVSVPAIGYLDFDFQDHGIIVDLKTQLRLASKISPSHARQGAIYSQSRGNNVDMRFAYVTPKKQAVFSMETDRFSSPGTRWSTSRGGYSGSCRCRKTGMNWPDWSALIMTASIGTTPSRGALAGICSVFNSWGKVPLFLRGAFSQDIWEIY